MVQCIEKRLKYRMSLVISTWLFHYIFNYLYFMIRPYDELSPVSLNQVSMAVTVKMRMDEPDEAYKDIN